MKSIPKEQKLFPDKQSLEELEGQIERVTYFNEETGYGVIKLNSRGYRELVTAVGNLTGPGPGEVLKMKGNWINHPKFGRQFKIIEHRALVPASINGIKKYLGSGMIKGLGPVMAERIVKRFGEKTLDIIENRIGELKKIEGIGRKRVEMIKKAWLEQKEIREVMIFLQEHNVSTGYAVKIFKRYGLGAISVVTNNPYRLATDIFGIGFQTADEIARNLGFAKETPSRVEAGILYILGRLSDGGHVYYPYEDLVEKCVEMLDVERDLVIGAFGPITIDEKIVLEDINDSLNESLNTFKQNNKAVYLKRFHVAETGVAFNLSRLMKSEKGVRTIDSEKAIEWVQGKINMELAPKQIEALKRAINEKVMVITGGPGTGKTTIIKAIMKIYMAVGAKIQLAAPTGRASKRMNEATGYPAKTIHRMLEYNWKKGGFQKDQDHPLDVDVLILDEVSMVDTILMHHLLNAVPSKATIIFVGDCNQLPSVGAGNVLTDIIESGSVPVVELKEIFRQAGESLIIVNAHRINKGQMPEVRESVKDLDDFYFIEQEQPEQVLNIILELVSERIPSRFNLNPFEGIQVLSPMHKGNVGIENLNNKIQEILNPNPSIIEKGGVSFRLNDKVIQLKNNYEKDVFNGDIGRIQSVDQESGEVFLEFDGRSVPYEYTELDEIALAYAISVHKSQGSEYPAVIIPLLTQHYILLQRNLIYTGVTRGKRLVVIVGSKKALAMGVKNDSVVERYSFLARRLSK